MSTTTDTDAVRRLAAAVNNEDEHELAPRNALTGAAYRGGNVARLYEAGLAAGVDPTGAVWAGFRQWRDLGRTVRRGEHGTPCLTVVTVDENTRKPRGFTVFHISQTDPLPAEGE